MKKISFKIVITNIRSILVILIVLVVTRDLQIDVASLSSHRQIVSIIFDRCVLEVVLEP